MDHIIVVRYPNGDIRVVSNEDGIMVFSDFDKAFEYAKNRPFYQGFPYQIIALDEL